jgi:hypothetical protein
MPTCEHDFFNFVKHRSLNECLKLLKTPHQGSEADCIEASVRRCRHPLHVSTPCFIIKYIAPMRHFVREIPATGVDRYFKKSYKMSAPLFVLLLLLLLLLLLVLAHITSSF